MKSIFIISFICVLSCFSTAQNINDLTKEKEKTKQQIKNTNNLLNDNIKSSSVSLNRLQIINSKVYSQKKLISQIQQELDTTEAQIRINSLVNDKLKDQIKSAQDEYSKLVYNLYFHNDKYGELMYILSSSSIEAAYRRFRYLKELSSYQKNQSEILKKMRDQLNDQTNELMKVKEKSKNLYSEKEKENKQLLTEKEKQNEYLISLKQKQQELKKQLNEFNKKAAKLNNQIEKVIAAQTKKNTKRTEIEKKVDVQLSENFATNKGKLPWPSSGAVISQFGKNQISSNITIDNSGIDIQTTKGSEASAVFNGEVTGIFTIPGYNNTIIIRHGVYLSVYSNLIDIAVSKGSKVLTGQKLGHIFTDTQDGNKTILHFEIWKETIKQNPMPWLR